VGILDRLFGAWHRRGRLAGDPPGHTGRAAPVSVQRAHLALADVDLPAGVVKLRTGEVRAILGVSGQLLHHRDPQDALDFLERWAAALNAMPAEVTMLARDRPGGLGGYVAEKAAARRALAKTAPGTGLARLATDQLKHALDLMRWGSAREVVCWLAVREARGDVRALLERAGQAADRLRAAGLTVEPLRDRALATAISDSWRPGQTESFGIDYWLARGPEPAGEPLDEWTLMIHSDNRTTRARVKKPRYVDPDSPAPRLPAEPSPALPRRRSPAVTDGAGKKALP
jgi:hypothetical protein